MYPWYTMQEDKQLLNTKIQNLSLLVTWKLDIKTSPQSDGGTV
jgi:hypothetical protein